MNSQSPESSGSEQPLIGHLIELRNRLLRIVMSVLIIFIDRKSVV